MISLSGKLKLLEKLAIDNSPVLLTAIGVAGTIGTAILTHRSASKATLELVEIDAQLRRDQLPALGRKEVFQETWKYYIPPVISGTLTVGAIVMANHIGTKRAAAIATAYTISERAYSEYREKVIEKIGDKKENEIRNEIVQERVRNTPMTEGNVLMVAGGDHLFIEMYTGRYFRSDMETVKKAVNEVNYKINTHGYASISDFYDLLELEHTSVSDEMGWTGDKLMDIDFDAVLSEKGQPCVGISFTTVPVRRYDRFH